MRLLGLFRQDDSDYSNNIDAPDKQLVTVISENINTKYIAFIFLEIHV